MFFPMIFMEFQVTVNSVVFCSAKKTDHTFDGDHTIEDHTIDGGEYIHYNLKN